MSLRGRANKRTHGGSFRNEKCFQSYTESVSTETDMESPSANTVVDAYTPVFGSVGQHDKLEPSTHRWYTAATKLRGKWERELMKTIEAIDYSGRTTERKRSPPRISLDQLESQILSFLATLLLVFRALRSVTQTLCAKCK